MWAATWPTSRYAAILPLVLLALFARRRDSVASLWCPQPDERRGLAKGRSLFRCGCFFRSFAEFSAILPADILAPARHDRHRVTTLPLITRKHVGRKDAAFAEVTI